MKIFSHASAKKKAKRLLGFNRVSYLTLLLVILKSYHGSEGVKKEEQAC